MTTIPHEPTQAAQEKWRLRQLFLAREVAASLAISVMWLAVLFDALFGPDIVSTSGGPTGSSSTVPSAVAVALFAFLASWAVAKYAFRREPTE